MHSISTAYGLDAPEITKVAVADDEEDVGGRKAICLYRPISFDLLSGSFSFRHWRWVGVGCICRYVLILEMDFLTP